MAFFGGRFGGVLDGLEANFLIRATQANRDSESLTAPKVTVLSGESATLQVIRTIRFALPPNVSAATTTTAGSTIASTGSGVTSQYNSVYSGPTLNITPTITQDKKHVLLDIKAELQDFLGFDTSTFETPFASGNAIITYPYTIQLPQTERSRVQTRVNVPDGGTLLLGGLKNTASTETEVGVPVLSKIPIVGRLFTNRSKVADKKVLLILVKPTIILQEEADAEAVAATEDQH
jgi:general secretion pathway protein D